MFRLRGSVAGAELSLPLIDGLSSIGSASSNRLILDQDGVSRHHAIVIVESRRILVTDQESKNGTFINGERVRQADAVAGDAIGFGPVELRIEEIDPDDARLAVAISSGVDARHDAPSREMSTASHRLSDLRLDRWVTLIRHFFERLSTSSEGGDAPALDLLTRELSASGACLAELGDAHEPVVLAVAGDVEASCLDRARRFRRSSGRQRHGAAGDSSGFFTEPDVTCIVLGDHPELLALVIHGDFPGRERSEQLLHTLLSMCRHLRPERHRAPPAAAPDDRPDLRFPDTYIRGRSAAMAALEERMRPLVQGDLPVLIVGETGVGKELLAQALHLSSPRRAAAFVPINCAAIPADLLEAELFGIGERVATGVAGRRGKFQQAQGGTLFLDEIGEMPAELQAKLLRVLQEKEIEPLGSTSVAIDVRLLAATNADVSELIHQGRFRRDLFFRIAGSTLDVPSLRQRREDIPLLVEGFLRRVSRKVGKSIRGITVRALRGLVERDWPGNIRELEHEVRRLVNVCPDGQAIESRMLEGSSRYPGDLAATARGTGASTRTGRPAIAGVSSETPEVSIHSAAEWPDLDLEASERRLVREAIRRTEGNQVQAAKLLGISRHQLRRRMDRFGLLDKPSTRKER